jgi:putative SOS response-associated peptidase YedK
MPSRITQHRSKRLYAEEAGWDVRDELKWRGDRMAAYNVVPGTWPYAMHTLHPREQAIDTVHWGFRPESAVEQGIPAAIRVTIEKGSTGRYFRHMWRQGRVIVPADGWYEWTGPHGQKQPWYIHLKTDRPMFLAAISNFVPYKEGPPGSGFVIVTAAAGTGLVDMHGRRPVVLAPEDARLWMDHAFSAEQAEQLARAASLPPDAFEWYRVSTDVNDPRINEEYLIQLV